MHIFTKITIILLLAWLLMQHEAEGKMGMIEEIRLTMMLKEDTTDMNAFNTDNYLCLDYSMDLIRNASRHEFALMLVNIKPCDRYENGHYAVAYKETDGNWTIIEPQTDEIINDELMTDNVTETLLIVNPNGITRINARNTSIQNGDIIAMKLM
jgi:hypothetical protein